MSIDEALKVVRRMGIKVYLAQGESDLWHIELPGAFLTRLITSKELIDSAIDFAGTPDKKWYWLT